MKISLAQWSLHRAIESGRLRGLEFPRVAREEYDIGAVELVNTLLETSDAAALRDLRSLADGEGVRVLLVMIDEEGDLSAPGIQERREAVAHHHHWLDRAQALGCHAIRVNTGGGPEVEGDAPVESPPVAAALERCAASVEELCDLAAPARLSVLVENHGGLSANVPALLRLQELVDRENFGTLPDFGNFPAGADRYAAIERLMPFAKAVSAKCFDFDAEGSECTMDFPRLVEIVRASGYDGYLGIEYEGERLAEEEGVRAAKKLLERLLGG